jgi:cation diffusion facilitator CzcD-associated flavoprotein CzcO
MDTDVIVLGAGFAGVAAARDLRELSIPPGWVGDGTFERLTEPEGAWRSPDPTSRSKERGGSRARSRAGAPPPNVA